MTIPFYPAAGNAWASAMGPFLAAGEVLAEGEKAEETKVQMAKKAPAAVQKNLIRNFIASRLKGSLRLNSLWLRVLLHARASLRLRTYAGLYKLGPRVGCGVARGAGTHRSHAVDRLGGLILGSKDGHIDVTVTVRPQADGTTRVASGFKGQIDRDLTLSRRFDSAYERCMGR